MVVVHWPLKNRDKKDAVMISLMTTGSGHISLNNYNGTPLLWMGETAEKNADLKLYNSVGKLTSRLSCTNVDDGSMELFNKTGTRMVHCATDVNGEGTVNTYDRNGQRKVKAP